MHETIVNFAKLTLIPLGSGMATLIAVTETAIGNNSSVTVEFLFAAMGLLMVIFMAVVAGLWKLSALLSGYKESIRQLQHDGDHARDVQRRTFEKLDELTRDFASFSAKCPAQKGERDTC